MSPFPTPAWRAAPILFALCMACATSSSAAAPASQGARLQSQLQGFARQARPAQLGIAVTDFSSGASWGVDADVPFIMMSVFKAPVVAATLAQIEAGTLSADQHLTLTRGDLVEGSAVPSVGAQLQAGRTDFTVRELMTGAVMQSDSTAADALVKLLGGPQVVTTFLKGKGITGMHVDTDERGIGLVSENLAPGQALPAHETAAQAKARERRGYAAMLADPRNRSTPAAAVDFLHKLSDGALLSPASTQFLIDLMRKQTVPFRLRGGIPPGADFADKTGSSATVEGKNAAWNDIALLTLADGRRIGIAVFMKDTAMPKRQRDALFAAIARAVAAGVTGP
jgi:beta-lactamase class A